MKQWFSDRLLSIKHGGSYVRAFFSPAIFALYVLLFIQWIVTPYIHVGHLFTTFMIVFLIETLSFKHGVESERDWNGKHPQ